MTGGNRDRDTGIFTADDRQTGTAIIADQDNLFGDCDLLPVKPAVDKDGIPIQGTGIINRCLNGCVVQTGIEVVDRAGGDREDTLIYPAFRVLLYPPSLYT